jgi:hypothetical protein
MSSLGAGDDGGQPPPNGRKLRNRVVPLDGQGDGGASGLAGAGAGAGAPLTVTTGSLEEVDGKKGGNQGAQNSAHSPASSPATITAAASTPPAAAITELRTLMSEFAASNRAIVSDVLALMARSRKSRRSRSSSSVAAGATDGADSSSSEDDGRGGRRPAIGRVMDRVETRLRGAVHKPLGLHVCFRQCFP